MDKGRFLLKPSTRFSVIGNEGNKLVIKMKGENDSLTAYILLDEFTGFLTSGDIISVDVNLVLARVDRNPGNLNTDEEKALNTLIAPNVQELPGLLGRWMNLSATRVYAVMILDINQAKNKPVGLVAWTGPNDRADPSWWIHIDYRRNYYGSSAVDALAKEMKKHGVTGIKPDIRVQTPKDRYDNQSHALIRKLKSYF